MRWHGVVALATLVVGGCQKKNEKQDAGLPSGRGEPDHHRKRDAAQRRHRHVRRGREQRREARDRRANAAGGVKGRKIELHVFDTQGKPEEAAIAATRLINEKKATLLIGELGSTGTLALAPISETNKIPAISPFHEPQGHQGRRQDATVHVPRLLHRPVPGHRDGEVRATEPEGRARRDHPRRRERLLDGPRRLLHQDVQGAGGEIVIDVSYKAGDQDFKAQLTKLKYGKPDPIYVPGYYTDVALIAGRAASSV